MIGTGVFLPQAEGTQLRALVATLEREIAALPKDATADSGTARLTAGWASLCKQLALDPEPEVRACPKCSGVCMRMATVCGRCWNKLTPPA